MTQPADQPVRGKLLVYFDAHQTSLSEAEQNRMIDDLDGLSKQVEDFPQQDLHIFVSQRSRTNEYVVKTSLLLPGRTLVCSEHDPVLHVAYEKCVTVLEGSVKSYKDSLGQHEQRSKLEKGTHHELLPSVAIDAAKVEQAIRDGDYPAFRAALAPYEDGVRVRVGRWIERYPALQARMGKGMEAVDVAEGVFLAAFEGYDQRPIDERFGEWLVTLIDPTVRAIAQHPDAEMENIKMAETACDVTPEAATLRPGT